MSKMWLSENFGLLKYFSVLKTLVSEKYGVSGVSENNLVSKNLESLKINNA